MPAINQEIYEKAAKDVQSMQIQFLSLQDLINTLKDAGEDTTEIQAKAQSLKKNIDRWTAVLKNKGYME